MKKIFNILIIITLFLSMNLSVNSCAIAPEVITEETEETEVITTEEKVAEETTEETTEEETTEEFEIVSDPEFKEVIKNIIEDDFGGIFTELIYDENNNTFYLAYDSKWYDEDTIKKEIFDVVSLFAPNNYDINLNIVVTTGFGESHHFYTKTDILIKIKNYEISYEEWLDEAFLK